MAENTDTSTGVKRGNYLGGVAFWSALLTVGIIALALGYDADRKGLMPGRLSTPYRVIADCAACHSSVGKSRFAWVSAIFAKADAHADSARCISCHSLGDTPNSPHGLPAERLAHGGELGRRILGRAEVRQGERVRLPGGDRVERALPGVDVESVFLETPETMLLDPCLAIARA